MTAPPSLVLSHATLTAAVDDLRRGLDRLVDDRDRVRREVEGLLDVGWSGRAAGRFAEAWRDWVAASADVVAGLRAMGGLLEAAHEALTDQDQAAAVALDAMAARIVTDLAS